MASITINSQWVRFTAAIAALLMISSGCSNTPQTEVAFPALQSILVSGHPAGVGTGPFEAYQPTALVPAGGRWGYRVTLTKPAPAGGITVKLKSDPSKVAPVPTSVLIAAGKTFEDRVAADPVTNESSANIDVAITASLASVEKTAHLNAGFTPR